MIDPWFLYTGFFLYDIIRYVREFCLTQQTKVREVETHGCSKTNHR
ncbi:hypothetical protein [Enterococcus phage vB_Efm3_KEN20]